MSKCHSLGVYSQMLGKVVKMMPEGRKCRYEGCNTTLSIYNKSKYCSIHCRERLEMGLQVGNKHSHGSLK